MFRRLKTEMEQNEIKKLKPGMLLELESNSLLLDENSAFVDKTEDVSYIVLFLGLDKVIPTNFVEILLCETKRIVHRKALGIIKKTQEKGKDNVKK